MEWKQMGSSEMCACVALVCPAVYLYWSSKTENLPVVLYGCETWSLTLREKHRLRLFENKALRRIFGPKRHEVMGERRKLHNGELHNLYPLPDIIRQIKSRRMRWAGIWHAWEREETCTGFGGKA
jgi:hypothetical protein